MKMKTFTKAEDAIERSISHTEIAYCESSDDNYMTLLAECDDYVATGCVTEFWKNSSSHSGMEWRVHIGTSRNGYGNILED
jgi:hypothetical protein